MSRQASRVVITGAGLSTCLGVGVEATWRGVLSGRSGLGPLTALEGDGRGDAGTRQPSGGQATPLPHSAGPPCADASNPGLSREVGYLRATVREALISAGLAGGFPYLPRRCGCIFGTTLHGMRWAGRALREGDPGLLADFPASAVLREAIAGLDLTGPRLTTCAACSSGLASIGLGAALLHSGDVDLVIAGGYDPISEYAYAGFDSLRLVARGQSHAFCAGRDGMNIAEGYAIVVLERDADAERRRARPIAWLRSLAMTTDCHHLTQPHPEGEGARRAIQSALESAGLAPACIGLVSAHATGTPSNDAAEHAALSAALGDDLQTTPIVAFKSHIGHTLGGAGAAELILSAMAMRNQVAPPTAGIEGQDLEYPDLRLNAGPVRPALIDSTMNLSLGFGGANVCAILSRGRVTTPATEMPVREVFITGVGVVSPAAVGNQALAALLSAPPVGPPPAGNVDEQAISHLLNTRRVRRMSEYVRLTLAAAAVALEDAGVSDIPAFSESCAAVLGTTHGSAGYSESYYRQIIAEGMRSANPMLFAEGVPNAGAAQLSLMLGIKGPCQTIIGSRTSGLDALRLAALHIARGVWERAIVGAAEEDCAAVAGAYEVHGLCAGSHPGWALGEEGFHLRAAGAAIVLESARSVESRGGRVRGRVRSGGALSASRCGPLGVARTVRDALHAIGNPHRILCSANGTWLGRMELRGLTPGAPQGPRPLIGSITDYLGETFSAGPLASIAGALVTGRLMAPVPGRLPARLVASGEPLGGHPFAAVGTDWSGLAAAVAVEPAAVAGDRAG